jgi:nicotinamidase-related amidase
MSTVINFTGFRERGREAPTLVLIDLHHDHSGLVELGGTAALMEPITNCRAALKHARASGMRVAFTRQVAPPANMLSSTSYPRWIEGFEPNRWDMIFDRSRPSCYASPEFRDMVDEIGGNYVIAGQFGERSCLSTVIEAFHRDHRPVILADAIVSRSYEDVSAGAMLKAAACILPLYAQAALTQSWILSTSRKVGARG